MKCCYKVILLALFIALVSSLNAISFAATTDRTSKPSVNTRATAPSEVKWKKGDPVEVEWSGTWYPAEILEAKVNVYHIHYLNYESNWDEDVAPARIRPRPGVTIGTNSNPVATVVRSGGTIPEPQLPVLASLSPRYGYVVGRAVFEDGRPIPSFSVRCMGTSGVLASSLSSAELLGNTEASAGGYALKLPENATLTAVTALATLHYGGKNFYMQLCPTATRMTPRLISTRTAGIVQNFVLKMTGRKPGVSPASSKAYSTNDHLNAGYFGGTVALDCGAAKNFHQDALGLTSLSQTCPINSTVTVILAPSGPRLDGAAGQTIRRSVPLGAVMYLYGIPYGVYTASAHLIKSGGEVHNLRLSLHALTEPDGWLPAVPIEWSPLDTNVAEVIGAVQLHLVE